MSAHTVITHAQNQGGRVSFNDLSVGTRAAVLWSGVSVPFEVIRMGDTCATVRITGGERTGDVVDVHSVEKFTSVAPVRVAPAPAPQVPQITLAPQGVACAWQGRRCRSGQDRPGAAVVVVAGRPLCGFHSPYDAPKKTGVSLGKPGDRRNGVVMVPTEERLGELRERQGCNVTALAPLLPIGAERALNRGDLRGLAITFAVATRIRPPYPRW
jgi:hypothetical protein